MPFHLDLRLGSSQQLMNILRRRQPTKLKRSAPITSLPHQNQFKIALPFQPIVTSNKSSKHEQQHYSYMYRRIKVWLQVYRKIFYITCTIAFTTIISFWHISVHYILPATSNTYISPILGFHPEWHPPKRSDRFPSVEERVKLYMSNYYLPPCVVESTTTITGLEESGKAMGRDERISYSFDFGDDNEYPIVNLFRHSSSDRDRDRDHRGAIQIARLDTKIEPDIPIILWEKALEPCYFPNFKKNYCPDARKMASMAKQKHVMGMGEGDHNNLANLPPIIAQFGDHPDADLQKHSVPFFKKFREGASPSALKKVTNEHSGLDCEDDFMRHKLASFNVTVEDDDDSLYAPIIWLLNYRRHYGFVPYVKWIDSPWELKKNQAVWRGLLTGPLSSEEREGKTFLEGCDMLPRCRFVRDHYNVPSLDIGVSYQLSFFPIDSDHLDMIKGSKLKITLLHYKAIIIMEGNDVSSGLKWALYSRSVVMMPPPTKTSFLMEELLEPWVHYIPLKPDLSDVSEKMKWVIEHDEAARRIAERATLFIHDLLYHADAESDNKQLQEEILRRYSKFFISK